MTTAHLEALEWTVITIWECELRKNAGLNARLDALADEIVRAGDVKSQRETEKRKTRMEAMKVREEILRRQAMLEAEIDAFSLPPRAINPKTREEEKKRLCDIARSHLARRTFIGNIYKLVKDPNLVSALTGHAEGSRAFNRYRDIDIDMKRDLVKILEGKH